MGRQVILYAMRRDAQRFDVPLENIDDTVRNVLKLVRGEKPAAVDVLINDKVIMPTDENRQLIPPPDATIVLVQNCSSDVVSIPNKAWRFGA